MYYLRNEQFPNMTEKHNILIYYYRNAKKLAILKNLRFILDVQQRFIGAIFVLILLQKNTLLIVLIYWIYIAYFYYSENDANQLKKTNMFIAIITLLQYTIILFQQQILTTSPTTLKETNEYLIDYIGMVINGNYDYRLSKVYSRTFSAMGIGDKGLKQQTLLYDSIPTVLFQVTMFYYDFFLLFCAERIETIFLRVRNEIFFAQYDSFGKLCFMIDYKSWKDPTTRFLLNMTNLFSVRLIEILVVILLILNIFYASPIWNFIRLGILFSMYSSVAFRSVRDSDLVRDRIKKVLLVGMVYLWARVMITSILDVAKSITTNPNNQVFGLLGIEIGEKLILVFEFFLIEYVSTVYSDKEFKAKVNKIIKKKLVRSNLVATSMTYNHNEKKLMAFIEEFSQRIKLEEDIRILNGAIAEWKEGRTKQRQLTQDGLEDSRMMQESEKEEHYKQSKN